MLFKKRKAQKLLQELNELEGCCENDPSLNSLDNCSKEFRTLTDNFFEDLDSLTKEETMSQEQFKSEVKKLSDKFVQDSITLQAKYKDQIKQLSTFHEKRVAITKELDLLLGEK